jgi:Ca2+-binding RTX toxin-like protein
MAYIGTRGPDVLQGGAEDDQVFGQSSGDWLYGGLGSDALHGGYGNDFLYGGEGNDLLGDSQLVRNSIGTEGSGDDFFDGGAGADRLFGDLGSDALHGGSGADMLSGGFGPDALFGGSGADSLDGGGDADILYGGGGNDLLLWSDSAILLDGGRGIDRLRVLKQHLDLRDVSNDKLTHIEGIELYGIAKTNKLILTRADVLEMSSPTDTLTVFGERGDSIDIVGRYQDLGVAGDFHGYKLGSATLLVDTDITSVS